MNSEGRGPGVSQRMGSRALGPGRPGRQRAPLLWNEGRERRGQGPGPASQVQDPPRHGVLDPSHRHLLSIAGLGLL